MWLVWERGTGREASKRKGFRGGGRVWGGRWGWGRKEKGFGFSFFDV